MAVEPPTLVGHLDKLVDEGFVERRRDRRDRRITRVFLTAAGERRLVELHRVMTAAEREYRSILSPDELEWLGDALSRISEHFRGLKEKEEARGR